MTDLRKAAEMALEALNVQTPLDKREFELRNAAIEALRQALAQPEQEPVAHLWECIGRWTAMIAHDGKEANLAPPDWLIDAVKAATAPPKREWVGLTDEDFYGQSELQVITMKYAEAKLKKKNGK